MIQRINKSKYANGGKINGDQTDPRKKATRATRNDSILIYNAAIRKQKFYANNKGYDKYDNDLYSVKFKDPKVLKKLEESSLQEQRIYAGTKDNGRVGKVDPDKYYITNKDIKDRVGKVPGSDVVYRAPDIISDSRIDTYFNPAAPPIYFSSQILPQGTEEYGSINGKGDYVNTPYYSPLAVKPFDLLTDKQKAERVRKHGRNGVPSTYKIGDVTPPKPKITSTAPLLPKKEKAQRVKQDGTDGVPSSNGKPTITTPTPYTEKIEKPYINKVANPYPVVSKSTIQENKYSATPNNKPVRAVPKVAKKYKIETSGGRNVGGGAGWTSTQTISRPEQLSGQRGDKTKITPIYKDGGKITNDMKYARLGSKKRYIAPAIIGAGVNMGMGLVQGALQKNAAVKARSSALNQMWKEKSVSDAQELVDYNTQGEYVDYYADGGKLPKNANTSSNGGYQTKGGILKTIGDGVTEAQGNTHGEKKIDNSYGITLHKGGNPIAEVEDQEILVDQGDGSNMVYSDRLTDEKGVTFAKRMKQLTAKRNKLDKRLEGTRDTISRNTIERQLAGLNMAEETLTAKQEMVKMQEGQAELNKLAYGGKVKKYALSGIINTNPNGATIDGEEFNFGKELAPRLIDNAVNTMLTLDAPKVPKPILDKAERFETNYNINPQLAENKRNTVAAIDNISRNSSNSNVARANIASTRLRGLEVTNSLLGQKENMERQARNQNAANRQTVNTRNNASLNDYTANNFARANDIQTRISSNVADISSDIKDTMERKDQRMVDAEIMQLMLADDDTGAKLRTMARLNPKYRKYLPQAAAPSKGTRRDANFS